MTALAAPLGTTYADRIGMPKWWHYLAALLLGGALVAAGFVLQALLHD